MDYDVIYIGAGTTNLYSVYILTQLQPNIKILMLDRGNELDKRICPIISGTVNKCIHCKNCVITTGVGGSGTFSDGKFNITTQFGGFLNEYLSDDVILDLIGQADNINLKNGAPTEIFSTHNSGIQQDALKCDLHLLNSECRHLGTENNFKIMTNIYNSLKDKIEIRSNCPVQHIIDEHTIELTTGEVLKTKYLVCAPGRIGSQWLANECKNMNITVNNNRIDLGVRVEIPAEILKDITDKIYEVKLLYRTKKYNDIVRTFCTNPYGWVVEENFDDIITVNGHAYADKKLRSNNTNFALLVSNKMTEPFDDSNAYGKRIASLSNLLGGGVIVQRFGDLINGRRTNIKRLSKSFTKPTLTSATPGDLSLVIPKRQLDNIIETIYTLDKLAPGIANDDTLLYGVEVKFYSSKIQVDNNLRTINGIFLGGDGAGLTRGIAQAAASGIYIANNISELINNNGGI